MAKFETSKRYLNIHQYTACPIFNVLVFLCEGCNLPSLLLPINPNVYLLVIKREEAFDMLRLRDRGRIPPDGVLLDRTILLEADIVVVSCALSQRLIFTDNDRGSRRVHIPCMDKRMS